MLVEKRYYDSIDVPVYRAVLGSLINCVATVFSFITGILSTKNYIAQGQPGDHRVPGTLFLPVYPLIYNRSIRS
jgi:hypothetical protein